MSPLHSRSGNFFLPSFGSVTQDGYIVTVELDTGFRDRCIETSCSIAQTDQSSFVPSHATAVLQDERMKQLMPSDATAWMRFELRKFRNGGAIVFRCRASIPAGAAIALMTSIAGNAGTPVPELGEFGRYVTVLKVTAPAEEIPEAQIRNFHRNPCIPCPLHTDGAYHEPPPDWIALVKLSEGHAVGGETTLLHIHDYEDLALDLRNPEATKQRVWDVPGGRSSPDAAHLELRGVRTNVTAPILEQLPDNPSHVNVRLGVDEYWRMPGEQPDSFVTEFRKKVNQSERIREVTLQPGDFYLINNRSFLHGRRGFEPNAQLTREVARLRGYFQ